jgi:hypothetical protein
VQLITQTYRPENINRGYSGLEACKNPRGGGGVGLADGRLQITSARRQGRAAAQRQRHFEIVHQL